MKLFDVKVGDVLIRELGGALKHPVKVCKVEEETITCSSTEGDQNPFVVTCEEGWRFLKSTGAEIDEDLGWDGITHTGSIIYGYADKE